MTFRSRYSRVLTFEIYIGLAAEIPKVKRYMDGLVSVGVGKGGSTGASR
jgi:hypothetical protein